MEYAGQVRAKYGLSVAEQNDILSRAEREGWAAGQMLPTLDAQASPEQLRQQGEVAIWQAESMEQTHRNDRQQLRSQADDQLRQTNIRALLQAFVKYRQSNPLPTAISVTPVEICRDNAVDCRGLIDPRPMLGSGIPVDPAGSIDPRGSGYFVRLNAEGGLVVSNPNGSLGEIVASE